MRSSTNPQPKCTPLLRLTQPCIDISLHSRLPWSHPSHQNKTESHFNTCTLCGTKVTIVLNSKYTTIDYSLHLLNPTSFWHGKKLGSFVIIVQKVLLIFTSFFVVAVILKKLKRLAFYWERENLYRILNNEHQKETCSLGGKLRQT